MFVPVRNGVHACPQVDPSPRQTRNCRSIRDRRSGASSLAAPTFRPVILLRRRVRRWCKSSLHGAIAEVQWLPERLAQVRQTAARRERRSSTGFRARWPSLPHAWPRMPPPLRPLHLIVPGTAQQAAAVVVLALRVAGHQLPRIGHSPAAPRRPYPLHRPDADHRTGDAGRPRRIEADVDLVDPC
jgi:hypothetical protein